jgi:hypothetical protein
LEFKFPSDLVQMFATWFLVFICFTSISPNKIFFPNEMVMHFYVLYAIMEGKGSLQLITTLIVNMNSSGLVL